MKLSCTQENLQLGLAIVSHLPTKSAHLPILHNILLRAEEKVFTLAATNLEIAVITTVRGKVEEPGEFTVPGKLCADYVSLLPQERVDMEVKDGQLAVSCGTYASKMRGTSATEFPLIPSVDVKHSWSVALEDIKKALQQTLFAVSHHESRPELCGVLFSVSGQTLTLASTDSFRLAERTVTLKEPAAQPLQVIVPARTLHEVSRIISLLKEEVETDALVTIALSENQITFRCGGTEIISRTIDGSYPDYKAFIPTITKTEILVQKEILAQAVKNAALFSRAGLFDVTLKVVGGTVSLTASDQNTGENVVELAAEVTGDQNSLTVNHRYLAEGIASVDASAVRLKIIDGANPIRIVPEGKQDHLYIVMPIKQ